MSHSPERLRELLMYDPLSGSISVRKSNRVLTPDDLGQVVVFDSKAKRHKSQRYMLDRLAAFFAFGKFPSSEQKVLHKNLDPCDNRLCNIAVVSKNVYRSVKEAWKNLDGGIRLVPHPIDQFSYVLYWFENGKERFKIIQDVVLARRQQIKLQLKYSKILTKYCIFD